MNISRGNITKVQALATIKYVKRLFKLEFLNEEANLLKIIMIFWVSLGLLSHQVDLREG